MEPKEKTVFIVDDDDDVLEQISTLLTTTDYTIKLFSDAESFMAFYRPTMAGCLVLDVSLTGMSGIELQQILTKKAYLIPTIIISATKEIAVSIRAFKAGAFDFIEKSYLQTSLVTSVQEAIEHDTTVREIEIQKVDSAVKFYAESIVETVRQPLFVLDQSLHVVLANKHAFEVFNETNHVHNTKQYQIFSDIIEKIPRLNEHLASLVVQKQELIDWEVTFDISASIEKTLIINARSLGQASSSHKHILLSIDDISKRKQIEMALFREKEQALVTLQAIGEGVITMDEDGIIQYLNPIAEQITDWSQKLAEGESIDLILQLVNENNAEEKLCPISLCLKRKEQEPGSSYDNLTLISRNAIRYSIELTTAIIYNEEKNITGLVVAFKDVSKQRELSKELAFQATHDDLTGLVNRREFEKRLNRTINNKREMDNLHILCFLDLDQFKIVNDTAGHRAGDELLKQISQIILDRTRLRDTLARIGGDEFGLILENCPIDKAKIIIETVINEVRNHRFVWKGDIFTVGLSAGIIALKDKTKSPEHLLSCADIACYTAKNQGRNRCHVYEEDGAPAAQYNESLRAAALTQALEKDQFRLYCQPIFSIKNNIRSIICYEILLRLVDDDGSILMPGSFIPAAERFGLMIDVDRWVIKHTFALAAKLQNTEDNLLLSINLSGNSLNDDGLLAYVESQFSAIGNFPKNICFEITESTAIHNLTQAGSFMKALKAMGCQFALDDFGSGLSSFSYLKKLPFDYLKIDGSFVKDLAHNPVDHAMVVAINEIGHTMGIGIIAEHAETEEVVLELQKIGVDYAQGFALQTPESMEFVFKMG